MELEASHKKILECLLKHSPANTFRLSRHLGIDRHELIAIIKDLTKKRLVEFKHGSVSINENRYQKLAENKEEKPAGLPKPLAVPEILNKPELKREEKSEKGLDSYIKESARDLKKQKKQFREGKKEGENAIKSIDKEFRKLEEKPSEKEPKTIKEELKKIPIKRKPQKAIVKSRIAKKKKEPKKVRIEKKPEKKKRHKKVKVEKKAKKAKRMRLGKEKQRELDQWIKQEKLEIEKLKIEIKLLSLSSNPEEEDIKKLRDTIEKIRNMINQKIRENMFSKLKTK